MRTIRRLYFFLVAFISVEVVLWGLVNLLRTLFSAGLIFPGASTLAQALALILVGVPIFIIHWGWSQRAARDSEEHSSILRAVFLYGILLATLVPVVQNTLALLNRALLTVFGLEPSLALLGGAQSWVDNLIAIALNAIAAAYFFNVLRTDWRTLLEKENIADVRRLYRYIWVLYSLLMTIFGAQQVFSFIFFLPSAILGQPGRQMFVNGLALLLAGAPLWAARWTICQQAIEESAAERGSTLRLVVLYLLALAGVFTVLSSSGVFINILLRRALGETLTLEQFFLQIGSPISMGVPLGVVWAYYGRWLGQEINASANENRRASLWRLYAYILSLVGLVASFVGLAMLFSFIIETLAGSQAIWGEVLRNRLSASIATLLAGLPLWLLAWRPMQAQALSDAETGDNARSSLVRRIYLYLVIFAAVIGGMSSAIWLFYTLLYALLDHASSSFLLDTLNGLQLLGLFSAFLAYHWIALRRDGSHKAQSLAARQEQFPVLVFEQQGSGFAAPLQEAIKRASPFIPTAPLVIEQGIPEEADSARAVVLPAALALNPPETLRLWLLKYEGAKILVQQEAPGWYWPGGLPRNSVSLAAQMVRQLAEGQEVRNVSTSSGWQAVFYVLGVLFAIQLLLAVLIFGISLVLH